MPVSGTSVDRVPSWEAHIRAMEREWGEILVRQTRALLAGWREAMSEMRGQQDRLVFDGLWVTGPSDFLDIIGLARHENTHSLMLEWFFEADRPTRARLWSCQAPGGTRHGGAGVGARDGQEGGVLGLAERQRG